MHLLCGSGKGTGEDKSPCFHRQPEQRLERSRHLLIGRENEKKKEKKVRNLFLTTAEHRGWEGKKGRGNLARTLSYVWNTFSKRKREKRNGSAGVSFGRPRLSGEKKGGGSAQSLQPTGGGGGKRGVCDCRYSTWRR